MHDDEVERIRHIEDPVERARAAGARQDQHQRVIDELAAVRREAIDELLHRGLKQAEIARQLGVSRARLNKLVSAEPGPERALLVPQPQSGALLTVAVVEKRERERSRPSVLATTHDAVTKLDRLARKLGLETEEARIPELGFIDLNQDNLAVLVGPRISPLIAQAITADPVIKWRNLPGSNNWALCDTSRDVEFRSDFDEEEAGDEPRTCYAHIGRIRRPDGGGSFLYLGGAHGPGTAGAVEYFVANIAPLWSQVRRNLWSAVVKTTAVAKGGGKEVEILRTELATDVYVHGKR